MVDFKKDKRTVLTLDAGGTNFVFSAIQAGNEIIEPIVLPSNADNLDLCLASIIKGFAQVKSLLQIKPVAISFAFPGPADYPNGIIGDLGNLKAFRGGIPLGPMLKKKFNIPVFINNDGDLFTYGEAIAGLLPYVNQKLKEAGSPKHYKNLFGITLGTGFGGGIVQNNELYIGDNSAAGEIWLLRNKKHPKCFAEEGVSIRAIKRVYEEMSGINAENLSPEDIYNIAMGNKEGNKIAAMAAFNEMGEVIGDALANVLTLLDGLVVIGGGLAGASNLFLDSIILELNSQLEGINGGTVDRMEIKAFNLEKERELNKFLSGELKNVIIPGSNTFVKYDSLKRTGIGISKLGTSKAVSMGAYAFALANL